MTTKPRTTVETASIADVLQPKALDIFIDTPNVGVALKKVTNEDGTSGVEATVYENIHSILGDASKAPKLFSHLGSTGADQFIVRLADDAFGLHCFQLWNIAHEQAATMPATLGETDLVVD